MDEKSMSKIRKLLGDSELEKVIGGIGPDGPYPTPDIEEVKKTALMVYEMFGLELAIDFATSALGCSREEVIGWFPA